MTKVKRKWSFFEHLLYSQDIERHEARTEHDIAEELADHITASIQYIEAMGFDAESVYSKRIDEKAPLFGSILKKYRDKLGDAIERAKEIEP